MYKSILIFLFFTSVVTSQHTVTEIGPLDMNVNESSGLIFLNDRLITHNDSGNQPILFEMDTTSLAITRQVNVTNAENRDWEALAQDDTFIYIGDFGNNVGTRTDLVIYRIDKDDYLTSDQVQAELIEFSYDDQVDFSNNGNSDWDAEAFIALENELVVFTKQWQSQGSVAYSIPKLIGSHTATRIGSITEVGLVTDAVYDKNTSNLYILGYSSILSPFLIMFENSSAANIFNGTFFDFELGLSFVQAEGITQTNSDELFFTSEYFSRETPTINSEARLFKLEFPDPELPEEEPQNPEDPTENESEEAIIIYKDMSLGEFIYDIQTPNTVFGSAIFDASGKRLWVSENDTNTSGSISRSVIGPGIYYFAAYLNTGTLSIPFALY